MNIEFKQIQRNNSKYKVELINKATQTELIFKDYLNGKNIRYMFQKGFLKPYHRIVDFYFPQYRLIVEIDGGYHIDCVKKDLQKDKVWSRFKTLRILNSEVIDGSYIDKFNSCITP